MISFRGHLWLWLMGGGRDRGTSLHSGPAAQGRLRVKEPPTFPHPASGPGPWPRHCQGGGDSIAVSPQGCPLQSRSGPGPLKYHCRADCHCLRISAAVFRRERQDGTERGDGWVVRWTAVRGTHHLCDSGLGDAPCVCRTQEDDLVPCGLGRSHCAGAVATGLGAGTATGQGLAVWGRPRPLSRGAAGRQ